MSSSSDQAVNRKESDSYLHADIPDIRLRDFVSSYLILLETETPDKKFNYIKSPGWVNVTLKMIDKMDGQISLIYSQILFLYIPAICPTRT